MDLERILNFGKRFVSGALIASNLFLGSCKKDPFPEPTNSSSLYENVHLLKNTDLTSVTFLDYNKISFSQPQNFKVGDIISGGNSFNTPEGFLLKVNSIQNNGKEFFVSLASFDEAVRSGSFSESKKYNEKFSYTFERVLYDKDGNLNTTHDQTILKGVFSTNPELKISGNFDHGLKSLEFQYNTPMTFDLEIVNSPEGYNISKEISLDGPPLPPFLISICGIPSYVIPLTELNLGVVGNLKLSNFRVVGTANLNSRLYYDGSWHFEKSFNPVFFSLPKNYSPGEIDLRAYVSPKLALKLNHFVGPYVELEGDLEAKFWNSCLSHKVSSGIDLTLGIDARLFGKQLFDYNKKILEWEKILSEAGSIPSAGWFDDFDSYAASTFPSSWMKGGNSTLGGASVDNYNSYSPPNSLKLRGSENSSFPAMASRNNVEGDSIEYSFYIKNSSGSSSPNGAKYRGSIEMRTSPDMGGESRILMKFGLNGEVYSYVGWPSSIPYQENNWYKIKILKTYFGSNDIKIACWVNDVSCVGEYVENKRPYEDQLDWFTIVSGQGNVYFDNVGVKKLTSP